MSESLTQKEAASRLGMSPSSLRRRTKDGLVPRNEDGSYPWPEVRNALEEGERLTQKEAAARLEITPRQLRYLTSDEIVSRNEDGSYPWPQVQEEHDAFLEESQDERSSGYGNESYQEARARKTLAQAKLAEMEVRVQEGSLISIDDMEAMLSEPLEKVNAVLKSAPSRHGPRLAKMAGVPLAQAKAMLSEIVEAIRAELREVPDRAA